MHDGASSDTQQPRRVAGVRERWLTVLRSLQCKATVFVVALMLTVLGSVSGYLLRSNVRLVRDHQDEQLASLAEMLAQAAASTLAGGDREELEALARESADGDPLLYVVFRDLDGHDLARAEHRDSAALDRVERERTEYPGMLGIPVFHPGGDERTPLLSIAYPIIRPVRPGDAGHASAPLLGYVQTGMATNRWYRSLASVFDLLIGVGILVAVLAIPLGFLLVRHIISPLEGLADVMREFSGGNLNIRYPVRRHDEIGLLVQAFNRMADQHQNTHERIVRLNEELGQRVAARTKQLQELASREPLTGLYNRRYFNEVLQRRFFEAMRYETDLSVVMIDLDEFKTINDNHGHQAGDDVLLGVAQTITSQLRAADVAARFGGDEFIILLPNTDIDSAVAWADRVVDQFSREVAEAAPDRGLTMSMGIASMASTQPSDPDALIRAADQTMYRAKASGKNRILTATPLPNASATSL